MRSCILLCFIQLLNLISEEMIHFIELLYALILVTKFGVSFEQKNNLKQLDSEFNTIFKEITSKYVNGEVIRVISSGNQFAANWETLYSQMKEDI